MNVATLYVVVDSQENEKYALLSQRTCVFQNILDEGRIFASCECIAIFMLCLKTELQVKQNRPFDCFGRKQ